LKSSGLALKKRSLKPYNPLLHFTFFLIRRRWKHFTCAVFAVLFLVLAALGTVTVEFEAVKSDCYSCSNFWINLYSYYDWKIKI